MPTSRLSLAPSPRPLGAAAVMAAGDLVKEFCEETTCSVCLEYFRDPVMVVDCGHSFCRACITQYWGDADRAASCPQCRETFPQRSLRPNRQLANFVELVKKLEEGRRAKQKRGACETHEEPLKLFCKSDGALICVVCDRAKEHREHDVVPVEEAFQEYQAIFLKEELLECVVQQSFHVHPHFFSYLEKCPCTKKLKPRIRLCWS